MVRETRHLWVGNLPDNIREDRIREHFKRYGRVQSVKLLPRGGKEETGEMACTVAFMDIKSASKAHTAEHKLDDRTLTTEYYEPAAIPSSSSPPNASSGYATTSPSATRFPNGHSSADEHGNFTERFYDRTNNSRIPTDGDYIRRPGYHDTTNRGRNRDRTFRNGPYNNTIDGRHRTVNNTWQYEGNRYANQTNDTGYSTTATTDSSDRRSEQSTKKKTKSRSGSRTPSPSGSTSSRSPSRSRSRSSSSSSSSSTSRETSSTSSPKSRRLQSNNPSHQPVVHSEDRRPLAICVRNLPLRSSDTSLKDGLFHEYKKHGKVTWVKVVGQSSERHAIVCFKKPEDVEKALEVSYDKQFFGCKIEVAPYQGYDVEDNDLRPYEAEIDEFHPKATRTLFIGNLEKDVTASDLRKHFDQFGEIIEIDIKKQGVVSSYAFCQYSDIVSVVKAIRTMDGEHLNNNRIKLGFGKSMPTPCVWVDGINESVTDKYLSMQFATFGSVVTLFIDREKGQALIFFDQVLNAQTAVNKMRGATIRNRKIQVDFASRECQEAFFENLEKQGLVFERPGFDERRDSTARTFETLSSTRFPSLRYDTPTRPRTASHSSRTGGTTTGNVPCNTSSSASAIPSPGTPGSATPRGTGSRSRLNRYEYYDANPRSYDEYSQGSGASHDEAYEHEYTYHESPPQPTHLLDPLESRLSSGAEHVIVSFAPKEIRNLQKERVLLLEQLEQCPSSGDELISPKKRLKLEHLDGTITSDVIIEANRDHRKVMEVRRTSDASLKHLTRRPSIDGKHVPHDRSSYLPHTVCKRRKTAGSDSGRIHHYESSESVGGSRPGTPLCDERPENFAPTEPRRVPREREGPLTLPLPRFASQLLGRASVSVAGIKGQKENVLQSPPPAVTSPRVSKPPSPTPVPPPASPPPRPPSLSSNSSDSDGASPSPSLEERIKSLDEKYEKWSGSRALSTAGMDALAKLDITTRDRFKIRHKLLDMDMKEVQPSEIVKSVMAKKSVFDEDSKRLENVGEKYEPKDFNLFSRTPVSVQTTVPATTMSTLPPLKVCTNPLPKTPTVLSPRSSGAALTAAKGLQYPFPSHPPMQPSPSGVTPVTATTTASTPTPTLTPTTLTIPSTSTSSRGGALGDNRLKPCANASSLSDSWTPSKGSVNRSVTSSNLALINLTQTNKIGEVNSGKTNIPPPGCEYGSTSETKTKHSKVSGRRDSSNSEPKSRRNSETGRRCDVTQESENCDSAEHDRLEKARLENERIEKENAERARVEKERAEKERQEKERLEQERIEKERLERERLEIEKLEKERLERLEKERLEKERIERERKERKDREERERREREERERREREEREKREREERERREEMERREREREREEQLEKERKEKRERDEREKREREDKERRELEDRERREREEKEKREEIMEKEKEQRRRDKEEDRKHKEDNHEKRNDNRHRENHSESLYHTDVKSDKSTKDDKKDNHISKKDETRNSHEKSRYAGDRRKDSIKENICDKSKLMDNHRDRIILESQLSLDLDKKFDKSVEPSRRKERNNSLPTNIGFKRRLSVHEGVEGPDEIKRIKLEHKKVSERRDSKDEKNRSKHKNSSKSYDDKSRHNSTGDDKKKDKERDREERHKNKQSKTDKQKNRYKNRDKESSRDSPTMPKSPPKDSPVDKDFLSELQLMEVDKQKQHRRESKEKRPEFEEKKSDCDRKNEERKKHKESSNEMKLSDVEKHQKLIRMDEVSKSIDERKQVKRERIRKMTNSSDNSDSDEPKKHSIFDIVDDEPAYISMYDKVKARSCKNMQKQEEEKRQEKIKAKFSQLKQSRAKREEKKRSTSWDEDSESDIDRDRMEIRHKNRQLIASSDEETEMPNRKIYSDSDYECNRIMKFDSSDENNVKSTIRKGSKSRIHSDTSDDEFRKISNPVKKELFSDNEDQIINETDTKKLEELDESFKNNKHENCRLFESIEEVPEVKEEKYNVRRSYDISSAEESVKIEVRKKHKKKQKRQKLSLSSEEGGKIESDLQNEEKLKGTEKRKQHSKKDKKRDKTKDENRPRKSKKSKDSKRDGKMENIFGSLSDDSEGHRETESRDSKPTFDFKTESLQNISYISDSDSVIQHEVQEAEEKTRRNAEEEEERIRLEEEERAQIEEGVRAMKEEHRKRKEKKRREKEKRLREEQLNNDNSIDYIDLGKQLEDNIRQDDTNDLSESKTKNSEEQPVSAITEDLYRFPEVSDAADSRKEIKEKKKKRKKSKDEKQRHHHHHHHHEKNKNREVKKEIEAQPIEEKPQNSTPVFDIPSPPPFNKSSSSMDMSMSPQHREPMISPIPKTPSRDKKREKFIPGFGVDIDEKIHENAVKSISEFEVPKTEDVKIPEADVKTTNIEPEPEKPRVVISQEETEDAVAALLGESFGRTPEDRYNEVPSPNNNSIPEDNAQDDEEMRKAVQSLSASEIEIKPDTPQSEHDLQIDTDTEEQEEVPVSQDHHPRTPDTLDFSQPPKTPDIPSYFRSEDAQKSMPNIGSPPSLTPLKQTPSAMAEVRKVLDLEVKKTVTEGPRTVISQSWSSAEVRKEVPKIETIQLERVPPLAIQTSAVIAVVTQAATKLNSPSFTTTPVVKVAESQKVKIPEPVDNIPPLQPVKPVVSLPLHNMPAQMPYPVPMQKATEPLNSAKSTASAVPLNRLSITPLMVSKSMQIVPHSSQEVPKSIPERPRMVYHPAPSLPQYANISHPRMIVQTAIHRPNMLLPTRQVPPQRHALAVDKPRPLMSEPPKLVSTSYTPPSNVSKPVETPPIIISTTTVNSLKPFMPVIQEAPKLVSLSSSIQQPNVDIRSSQPSIIQTITKTSLPSVIPSVVPPLIKSDSSKREGTELLEMKTETLKVKDLVRTSTPSPVIVMNSPKELETPKVPETSISTLAIEKVTEELNLSLKKDDLKPEMCETLDEIKKEIKTEKVVDSVIEPKSSLKVDIVADQTFTSIVATEPKLEPRPATRTQCSTELTPPIKPVDVVPTKVDAKLDLVTEPAVASKLPNSVDSKQEIKEVTLEVENVKEVRSDQIFDAVATVPDTKPELNSELRIEKRPEVIPEPKPELPKLEPVTETKVEQPENVSVIKETEKFDEEKADTDSVVSDISKERLSADIKEDPLDSKEDSDYWSAKEVNIDSVIKTLCSADELSDRSSDVGKDEWLDEKPSDGGSKVDESPSKLDDSTKTEEGESMDEINESFDEKEVAVRGGRRGGRGRGRKARGAVAERGGVQTRRGKVNKDSSLPRGRGRGARGKSDRKVTKSESEANDVYEFRDDSDENNHNKDRPRLILTIKSPAVISANGSSVSTTVVKEIPKELIKEPVTTPPPAVKVNETKEEFASPANTRKSRRLLERDVSRNTVDDTIEDVVKNTMVTRAAAAAIQGPSPRRSTRQATTKPSPEINRKSPRGRKKDRRPSETTDDSSEEKSIKADSTPEKINLEKHCVIKDSAEVPVIMDHPNKPVLREKPHEGLKAAVLRRVKGEMNHEPMTLIDPVTGLLTPVRECEEGRYIPLGAQAQAEQNKVSAPTVVKSQLEAVQNPTSVVVNTSVLQQNVTAKSLPKPQSLKAHVLAKAGAVLQANSNTAATSQVTIQTFPTKITPTNPSVNVSLSTNFTPAHISPKPALNNPVTKPIQGVKVIQPPVSPSQMNVLTPQQKQQIIQQAMMSTQVVNSHMQQAMMTSQVVNTQMAHKPITQTSVGIAKNQTAIKPQTIMSQHMMGVPMKQQFLAGANPRSKAVMDPPKVEVSMAGCVMAARPNAQQQQQQSQQRQVHQSALPPTVYEAALHGDRSVFNRSRSPPPAHQNSPSPQGEPISHFPTGSVPSLRPHDVPSHFIHSQVMYQHMLRQQPYHLPRSPIVPGALDKVGDGQEGEEAPVTSPPLELRRPGSVGIALTGRSNTIPHSLQSPHERTTDSPQVYNMHTARMQQYHQGRYYEPGEPPPAHRPLTSHSTSLAALGSERSLSHMPLGAADRPLASHIPPERPLSSHLPDRPLSSHIPDRSLSATHIPDRPISSHITDRPLPGTTHLPDRGVTGLGLGAAGNIMGAVARHVGVDAPASQRGIQAATPPHASQVPPQAESLLMLLKQYPLTWQGLLALKNDQAAVQMYFVSGNFTVAKMSLPKNNDGSTPPLRIFQRMRLEPPQVEGVTRKMQLEKEHCMLLALPCGHDHMDVLKQSTNLTTGFITYLQCKQAAGIVNVAAPGTAHPPAYVVHIFPSSDFVNENLRRIAPSLLERVADIAHLLIVITTV